MTVALFTSLTALTVVVYLVVGTHQDAQPLNVYIVPHSHWVRPINQKKVTSQDVGWLRSPTEYYDESVKKIINNVVEALDKDPKRRFIFSEM
jgi:hypothetical protein